MSAPAESDKVILARLRLQEAEVRKAVAEAEVRKAEVVAEAEVRKAVAEAEVRKAEIEDRKAARAEAKAIRESESFINGGELFLSFFSGLKLIPRHSPHPNSSHNYCPLDHLTQLYFLLLHGGIWWRVSRVDPLSLGCAIPHHSQVVRSVPSHRFHVPVPRSSWQTPLPQVSNNEHARLR